jgi:hypothetical protein
MNDSLCLPPSGLHESMEAEVRVQQQLCMFAGLLGPYLIGAIKKLTGSFSGSIAALAGITTLAAICYTIILPHVAPDPYELAKNPNTRLPAPVLDAHTDV